MSNANTQTQTENPEQQRDRYKYERDQLAHAIAGAAVRAGGVREDAELTGPMLVQLVNDMADTLKQKLTQPDPRQHREPYKDPEGHISVPGNRLDKKYVELAKSVTDAATKANLYDDRMRDRMGPLRHDQIIKMAQFVGMKAEESEQPTTSAESEPTERLGSLPPELANQEWLHNSYTELKEAVLKAAPRASLENAARRVATAQHAHPHTATLNLTHQLGRTATPDGISLSREVEPESNSMAYIPDMLYSRYEEMTRAIQNAGKGAGLVSIESEGKPKHEEMLRLVEDIADTAKARIEMFDFNPPATNDPGPEDDDQGLSPR